MRGPILTFALGLFLSAPAIAQAATGFEAPDSSRRLELNEQLRTQHFVRVGIAGGSVDLYHARATEVGLEYERVVLGNGISYVTADDPKAPKLDWNRIGWIEARGHGTAAGTIVGLVVGGVVGWRIGASTNCHDDFTGLCEGLRPLSEIVLASLGAGLGAGLGAAIGSSIDPPKQLYP